MLIVVRIVVEMEGIGNRESGELSKKEPELG